MADLDIRAYTSAGLRKVFPMSAITGVSWEVTDRGGYGSATIEIKDTFEGALAVIGGDRFDIYVNQALRYRGYVTMPEGQLADLETRRITCMGRAQRLNQILVDKRYIYPAGTDVSELFEAVVTDYVSPIISGLVTDIQSVGVTVTELDLSGTNARDALDKVVDLASAVAHWGFDVDANGDDQVYVRPKSDTPTTIALGDKALAISYPPDYTQIVNKVAITGGAVAKANLVHNPRFETVKQADYEDGNLVVNPSFSSNSFWTFNEYCARENVSPHTGTYSVKFTRDDDTYCKQDNIPITAGTQYEVSCWAKISSGTPLFHIEIIPNVGSTIRVPTVGWLTPGSTYVKQGGYFTGPVAATTCSLKIVPDGDDDFRIDDVCLAPRYGVAQEGWQSQIYDSGTQITMDWQYTTDKLEGVYCARMTAVVPSATYPAYVLQHKPKSTVLGSTPYVCSCWCKSLSGNVDVRISMAVYNTSGASRWEHSDPVNVGTSWTFLSWQLTTASDDNTIGAGVSLRTNGDILIDCMMLTELNYDDLTGATFIPDANHVWTLSTADAFIQNDAGIAAAVKSSITDNGVCESKVSVPQLFRLADAQAWAAAYFQLKAIPPASSKISLECYETDVPVGKLTTVTDTDVSDYAVRSSYKVDGGTIAVSVELNTRRPKLERLLLDIQRQAQAYAAAK